MIKSIEKFIAKYITLADPQYSLPIALWIVATFCYPEFDAFPYLVITSATKRSGKTRLAELISFCCSNPRNFAAMTGPTLFRAIEQEHPTLIMDEAEKVSTQGATDFRAILNVGYRKGQKIPRTQGAGIVEFDTYCPKIFILIGDVYDTLRDRSIIITMRRADAPNRFVFQIAKDEGDALREQIAAEVQAKLASIQHEFIGFEGLPFLMDRDEEIWTALFTVASIFCPERLNELKRAAVDMSTEKTVEARRHVELAKEAEDDAMRGEYGKRLLLDLCSVFVGQGPSISTEDAIEALKGISVAPWRKFRGRGLTPMDASYLLSPFGVRPVRLAVTIAKGKQRTFRGYRRKDVETAMHKYNVA